MADEEALVDYEEDDNETDSKSDGKEIKKYVQFNIYQSKSYVDFPFLAYKITKKKTIKNPIFLSTPPKTMSKCSLFSFLSYVTNTPTPITPFPHLMFTTTINNYQQRFLHWYSCFWI